MTIGTTGARLPAMVRNVPSEVEHDLLATDDPPQPSPILLVLSLIPALVVAGLAVVGVL